SSTYRWIMPGIARPWSLVSASASITTESPMRTSACPILPSGVGIDMSSSAPNAFVTNSSSRSAPSMARYGVTEWYPFGMGCTGMIPPSWLSGAALRRGAFGLTPAPLSDRLFERLPGRERRHLARGNLDLDVGLAGVPGEPLAAPALLERPE